MDVDLSVVTVLADGSHATTRVPRWTSTPLASYHSWFCRSPPPPTEVWKPGRRAGAGLVEEGFGQRRALVRENFFRGTDEEVRASPGGDDGAGEVAGAVAAAHDDDLLGDLGGHRVWVGTSVCRDGMARRRGLLSVLIEKGDVSEGFAR
jgi:hypothetical protein